MSLQRNRFDAKLKVHRDVASAAREAEKIAAAVGPREGVKFHRARRKVRDALADDGASLASANAWAGHDKEAKDAAAHLQKVYPGFTVQTWVGMHWSDDPAFNSRHERMVEGLRKAGIPEGDKKPN